MSNLSPQVIAEIQEAILQLEIKKSDMEICSGLVKGGNQFVSKQPTPLLKAINTSISILHSVASGEFRPVECGHWIRRDVFGEDPYECSVCHNTTSVYGYTCCPYCGSPMDEPSNENPLAKKDDKKPID